MRAALEDSGPKRTERPKELSINIQGKDSIYSAADVREGDSGCGHKK